MKKKGSIIGIKMVLLAGVLVGASWLLGADAEVFYRWWTAIFLLGAACFPLTAWLFHFFKDRGWLISKVLGIAGAGFLTWLFVTCGWLKFTPGVCIKMAILMAAVSWACFFLIYRKKQRRFSGQIAERMDICSAALDGELIFLIFFILWTYVAGFRPAAYGTEKFMDYGFMMAMMRSEILPAKDLWFAGGNLNYYYGGQYFAVYLTKLTGTQVAQTYNLMRTLVAGFAFALPFVLVRQMILDIRNRTEKHREKLAVLGGVLAGAGVSLAGNMHYVLVGKVLPFLRNILGLPESEYTYWFPNSTRYIGYYPEGKDKTIHEFPSYSFVLGDLHAHVVNVMFVLAVICLVYACVQRSRKIERTRFDWKQIFLDPYVLVLSFFIGLFHWTNYWDFVIYYVMGGMGIIYCNFLRLAGLKSWKERLQKTAVVSFLHAIWVFFLGTVFALPFSLQFETMVSGVALAQNHSRIYQWWLIWGLPFVMTILFFWCVFRGKKKEEILPESSDFFGVILGISAVGLILIPEIVYVRDIYEAEYARSNTMFKLTYQAFIMFGILMAYAFVRIWMDRHKIVEKLLAVVGFLCFAGCCFYIGTAVHAWFGQVWDRTQYQGLDATRFLENNFSEDAAAIRWLNEEVEGSPVVLEAQGDSYSDYERVSAMTGLPTILGWYVHEWLWRGDIAELNQRVSDVEQIYTSTDEEQVRSLLDRYEVEYIFVGKMEREKFIHVNEGLLKSLGEVVYENPESSTYIVKVAEA